MKLRIGILTASLALLSACDGGFQAPISSSASPSSLGTNNADPSAADAQLPSESGPETGSQNGSGGAIGDISGGAIGGGVGSGGVESGTESESPSYVPVSLPPLNDDEVRCQAQASPAPRFLNRLTKRQLSNVWNDLGVIRLTRSYSVEIVNTSLASGIAFSMVPDDERTYNASSREDQTLTSGHVEGHFFTAALGADLYSKQATFPLACMNNIDAATDECIKSFIQSTGLKALRRPLKNEEVELHLQLFKSGSTKREGLKMLMGVFALAPQLMYEVETEGALRPGTSDVLELTDYEIASRISLAARNAPPTAAMYTAAAQGRFTNPATLAAEVKLLFDGVDRAALEARNDNVYGLNPVQKTFRQFEEEWLHLDQGLDPFQESSIFSKFLNNDETFVTWSFKPEQIEEEVHNLVHRHFWRGGNFASLLLDREFYVSNSELYGLYGYHKTLNNVCSYRYAMDKASITTPITGDRYLKVKYLDSAGKVITGYAPDVMAQNPKAQIIETEKIDSQKRILGFDGQLQKVFLGHADKVTADGYAGRCESDYNAILAAAGKTYQHTNRVGLLTRAGMLYQSRVENNPVQRGVFLRRQILCDDLSNPDADKLPDRALDLPEDHPDVTTRERYATKTSPALCMGCHNRINPLGFALEDYDALGRFRTRENFYDLKNNRPEIISTLPINAQVSSLNLSSYGDNTAVNGGTELSEQLARSTKANLCVSRQLFRFMNKTRESTEDACMISDMYNNLAGEKGSFEKMFQGFFSHQYLRLRKVGPQ